MKVKYASQILSNTVSAALNTYISLNIFSPKVAFTAEFIHRFNKLFDILNSSTLYNNNPDKRAFTNSDEQKLFLNDTISFLQNIKVKTKNGKDITNSIKSIKCWIITIKSFLQLWTEMEQFSTPIKFLFIRRLNQDALENFFGVIRTQNGNAYNPTPIQFYFSFKKLFRINYCHINTGNCEIDKDEILTKFTNFNEKDTVEIQTVFDESSINMEIDDYEYRDLPVNEENAFMYICGYLLKRCFIKHRCETCESLLLDKNNNLNSLQYYNYFKAYNSTENDIYGKLYIPTSVFVSYIKEMHITFFLNFKIICQSNVIQKFIYYIYFQKLSFLIHVQIFRKII